MFEIVNNAVLETNRVRKPIVSVVMPVYNGGKFIRGALDSLLEQSFTNFELIILDNASTDGTAAICKEYTARDPRIEYVRQESNIGAVANFQYGLNFAKGEYFMWAAYDDRWDKKFIEKLINIHHYDPECGLAFCDFESLNFITLEKTFYSIVPSNARSHYLNYLIRIVQMNSNLVYGLYKKDALKDFVLEPFDLCDVYLTIYIACRHKIRITNERLFVAGVTTPRRIPYSITGKKYSYLPFVKKQFSHSRAVFGFWKAFVALPLVIVLVIRMKFSTLIAGSKP
jgi:glycosyltransferase involved in cell wall biosynthesis